ncbi:MAG: chitobiase/beta-hexosaminidase C-terminal domain-containing protein [Candidatus Paceibacterota bacterium]
MWDTTLGTRLGPPLGDQSGWTEAELKARIGFLLDEFEYMHIDAFAATVRAAYFEAARDPNGYYLYNKYDTKSEVDTRASWDMFGYLISESHKRGIKVIWWHDPIYYGTANIYLWGDKYNECTNLNLSNSVCATRRSRLEVDEPVVKAYNYDLVKYVLENYDIDGIDLHEPFYVNPSYNPVLIKRVKDKYNWDITGAIYTEFRNSLEVNGKCPPNSTASLVNNPYCPNLGKLYDVEGDVWEELFAGYRQIFNMTNKKNPNVLLGGGGHHEFSVVHGINIADVMKTGNLDYYSSEDLRIPNMDYWKKVMTSTKAFFGEDLSWAMGLILNYSKTVPTVGSNDNFGVQGQLSCQYGSAYEHLYPFNRRNLAFGTTNSDTMYKWAHANPPSSFCGASATSVSAPTFSPPSGSYASPQSVSISTSTSGATTHYTTDNSIPTESSPTYTSPISVSSTTTIKAGAWKTGLTPSAISTAVYTITDPDTTSPVISAVSSSGLTSSNATITWTTDESSDSQVEYGTTTSYGSSTPINTSLTTSHSQLLVSLASSTLYHYRVKSKDSSGNLATSPDNTFTTLAYVPSANLLTNPGFELGTSSWIFYTDGTGSYTTISPGYELTKAAKITLNTVGSNMQFYQSGISLEPNTSYRLTFSAYSSTGHDVSINLLKNVSPYTNYGLSLTPNLITSWQAFTQDFTTAGFTNNITDGRLRFYFPGLASAGDIYYLDDLKLEKVISSIADLNSDNIVNSVDLGMLMSFWNYTTKPKSDLNQDGIVNSVDFGILLSKWTR